MLAALAVNCSWCEGSVHSQPSTVVGMGHQAGTLHSRVECIMKHDRPEGLAYSHVCKKRLHMRCKGMWQP